MMKLRRNLLRKAGNACFGFSLALKHLQFQTPKSEECDGIRVTFAVLSHHFKLNLVLGRPHMDSSEICLASSLRGEGFPK